ncbi:hypothetical protein H5410_051803 [Solanum commersonii]|uniref:Uncharacterized protein n=1 Tax=Solanum commersonii TaxID=4109 RepID=A0A9J5X237_SOLCO|nr:hypothetical protein H5410_051803 [Solanum commersonii]
MHEIGVPDLSNNADYAGSIQQISLHSIIDKTMYYLVNKKRLALMEKNTLHDFGREDGGRNKAMSRAASQLRT